MKVLVVGNGGREHAIVWKISQSHRVKEIYCAPGNAGISEIATCIPIDSSDIEKLLSFAKEKSIDLTVVGPEDPLTKGIVDTFTKNGLKIFGPSKKASQMESSKSFAKSLMMKYKIPTAKSFVFKDYEEAQKYINKVKMPVVIKADGLAAGKGVIICKSVEDALNSLNQIMTYRIFGEAGEKVIIEDYLTGEEASFIAFTDGKTILPLPSSQDHKALYDNDQGLNTGGMGAYSPAIVVDSYFYRKIMKEVMIPVVKAMAQEGLEYKGILYAGLMIDKDQIKVLEFNCRLGDPEAQPILMRLKTDIISIFEAVIDERLDEINIEIDDRPSVCVVMASGGYPASYKKGFQINGLKDVESLQDTIVFHSGTKISDGKIVTNGGRVLGVSSLGDSIQDAINKAYNSVKKISWQDVYYRNDIGSKAIPKINCTKEVGIVMGSDSDLGIMEEAVSILKKFEIAFEIIVVSAHRTPNKALEFATNAHNRGIKVIIAGAGHAAHLAGFMAANTHLPVIGVPIDSSSLKGLDALFSTVQMPPGVPVATMAIGKSGARNAGIFAVQILSNSNHALIKKLQDYKLEIASQVDKKNKSLFSAR